MHSASGFLLRRFASGYMISCGPGNDLGFVCAFADGFTHWSPDGKIVTYDSEIEDGVLDGPENDLMATV